MRNAPAATIRHLRLLLADLDRPIDDAERLASALDRYVDEHVRRHLKPRTQTQYCDALARLARALGDRRLVELTPQDLDAHLGTIPRGSLSSEYATISAALSWIGARGLLPVRRPKSRRRTAYLSRDLLPHWSAALSMARRRRWARPRMIELLQLATLVPLRPSEVVSLSWQEIDLPARAIVLPDSKTGPRWLPLGKLGASIVAAQPRHGQYVWTSPRRGPTPHITESGASHACARVLRRYAEHAAIRWMPGTCFDSLRHTWCSLALVSGEAPDVVRRVMGHSSAYMTERYAHVLDSELAACVERVQSIASDGLRVQLQIGGE